MTSLSVKILKDEDGNNFVPYTSTIALYDPDGETISDKIAKKLETSSLIAGTGITLIPDITNHTVEIQSNAPGANLINSLTTSVAGQGALVVGNSATKNILGAMVTPRGYAIGERRERG